MTTIHDGPAQGAKLTLQRSPIFLRVVRKPGGEWDALDQLTDEPAPDEEIHVYRRIGEPTTAHIDGRDPKTGKRYGRWMSFAEYRLHPEQPGDAQARLRSSWQEWCNEQGAKL